MANSTIDMKSGIRVKIESQYKLIYNGLKNNNAVKDFHELFFICVCIGRKYGHRASLRKKEDCFWSQSIKEEEWYTYYSIYVHDHGKDFSCLGSAEEVIDAMQEYANAGMQWLIDHFLYDYTKKNVAGVYIVDQYENLSRELLLSLTMDWGA